MAPLFDGLIVNLGFAPRADCLQGLNVTEFLLCQRLRTFFARALDRQTTMSQIRADTR